MSYTPPLLLRISISPWDSHSPISPKKTHILMQECKGSPASAKVITVLKSKGQAAQPASEVFSSPTGWPNPRAKLKPQQGRNSFLLGSMKNSRDLKQVSLDSGSCSPFSEEPRGPTGVIPTFYRVQEGWNDQRKIQTSNDQLKGMWEGLQINSNPKPMPPCPP